MPFRIYGRDCTNFDITVETSYYKTVVGNNVMVADSLAELGGKIYCSKQITNISFNSFYEENNEDYPSKLEQLLSILKKYKCKYSIALGPITITQYNKNTILITGYIKPKLYKAMEVFGSKPAYLSNNSEEGYLFSLNKYHNLVSLLAKWKVTYIDNLASSNKE